MDLETVRTFVAVADAGQFQVAAAELSITQQAASKRVATLEAGLGARLFTRTPRGASLTIDGQAFLPHARELLESEARAADSLRPGRRALRVDVVNRRVAPANLLQDFYRGHPDLQLDVLTVAGPEEAFEAVAAGAIDATFRTIGVPGRRLPAGLATAPRVVEDAHELLVGPRHALAGERAVTPAQLVGHPIWMPGLDPGTEAAAYYADLAATFAITIDVAGPVFGNEAMLAEIAQSPKLATLVGTGSRYLWPAEYDLRRIPVRGPTPVYPLSLVWRSGNRHPALGELRGYLQARAVISVADSWVPDWAQDQGPLVAGVACMAGGASQSAFRPCATG
jgi:DNA-binding transcriptional LysR family regulator